MSFLKNLFWKFYDGKDDKKEKTDVKIDSSKWMFGFRCDICLEEMFGPCERYHCTGNHIYFTHLIIGQNVPDSIYVANVINPITISTNIQSISKKIIPGNYLQKLQGIALVKRYGIHSFIVGNIDLV